MGLEGVEIIMKVEESFKITIEDSEAEKLATPCHLIGLILTKIKQVDVPHCLTQRAFHHLRGSLMRQCSYKRGQIKPETLLMDVFPPSSRKNQVRKVLVDIGVEKEIELVRPEWLYLLIAIGAIGGGVTIAFFPGLHPNSTAGLFASWPMITGILCASGLSWIAFLATRGMRVEFSSSMTTVGDLSRWMVANAPAAINVPPGQWSREQVAEIVRLIVIDILGCAQEYREDAHFSEELGVG